MMLASAQVTGHLTFYQINRYDPTHTTPIRNAFVRDMRKRFRKLCDVINKAIVDEDCFTLEPGSGGFATMADMTTPGRHAFDFPRSGDKLTAFMDWLHKQEQAGILEVTTGRHMGGAIESAWTNKYINSAYRKGISRARQAMRSAGYKVPTISATGGLDVAFNGPFHMDRVGLIYTRAFTGLQGITSAMDQQISHVLGQALSEGKNPKEIAKILTSTITGPAGDLGITDTLGRYIPAERRAMVLARTEVIRAHHAATMVEYRNYAVAGVKVQAEWVTAQDGRVCDECQAMEGQVFDINDKSTQGIGALIPLHPQCRCVVIPVDVTPAKAAKAPPPPKPPDYTPDFGIPGSTSLTSTPGGDKIERWQANIIDNPPADRRFWEPNAKLKGHVEDALRERIAKMSPAQIEDYEYFQTVFAVPNIHYGQFSREANLVQCWASTSMDEHIVSILMQKAAIAEFELTTALTAHIDAEAAALLERILSIINGEKVMRGARVFLRAMYEETQDAFKKMGVKTVRAARGSGIRYTRAPDEWKARAAAGEGSGSNGWYGEADFQPMSSFSTDVDVAKNFQNAFDYGSGGAIERNEFSVVALADIPVERIISMPGTGYGCFGERELVVLGKRSKVLISWSRRLQQGIGDIRAAWKKVIDQMKAQAIK